MERPPGPPSHRQIGIEQLEEELEDIAVELLLRSRRRESSADGVPLDDVIAELGFTPEELRPST